MNTLVCGLGCTEPLLGGRGSGFGFEFPARIPGFEIGAIIPRFEFRETGVLPMEPSPFGMIPPSGCPPNFHLTLPRWSTLLGLWAKWDLRRELEKISDNMTLHLVTR